MAYLTLDAFKTAVEIADTVDDADIQRALDAGAEWIDWYCGRSFSTAATTAARLYVAYVPDSLDIDDAASVSMIEVDLYGDGTFPGVLEAGDWHLYPLDAGQPGGFGGYTQVRLVPGAAYSFVPGYQVRVTGSYGFPGTSPPATVQQANLILSNRLFQRPHAPFGVQEAPISGELARISDLDPDVALLLGPYVTSGGGGAGAGAGGMAGSHWVVV